MLLTGVGKCSYSSDIDLCRSSCARWSAPLLCIEPGDLSGERVLQGSRRRFADIVALNLADGRGYFLFFLRAVSHHDDLFHFADGFTKPHIYKASATDGYFTCLKSHHTKKTGRATCRKTVCKYE